MNKIVYFDVDGVLAKFEEKLVNALCDEFGASGSVNRHLFSMEDRFAKFPHIYQRAKQYIENPNFYYGIEPDQDACDFAAELMQKDFTIMYVTSRPTMHESYTRRWLQRHTWNYTMSAGLFCGVENKAEFLSDVDIQFLVEDNPDEITRCKKMGIPVLVWSQEWNDELYPRLYVSSGTQMLWVAEDKEAIPFWEVAFQQ